MVGKVIAQHGRILSGDSLGSSGPDVAWSDRPYDDKEAVSSNLQSSLDTLLSLNPTNAIPLDAAVSAFRVGSSSRRVRAALPPGATYSVNLLVQQIFLSKLQP